MRQRRGKGSKSLRAASSAFWRESGSTFSLEMLNPHLDEGSCEPRKQGFTGASLYVGMQLLE